MAARRVASKEWITSRNGEGLRARRWAEKALVAVVAQAYVAGVSARRVDGLLQSMGIDGVSKSRGLRYGPQPQRPGRGTFRFRPLDAGPHTYVAVDALTQRVREGGPIVNGVCGGHRRQRRWAQEVLGRRLHRRDRSGLDGVPAGPGGPVGDLADSVTSSS